jgi:hypothetical protein
MDQLSLSMGSVIELDFRRNRSHPPIIETIETLERGGKYGVRDQPNLVVQPTSVLSVLARPETSVSACDLACG